MTRRNRNVENLSNNDLVGVCKLGNCVRWILDFSERN